MNKLLTLIAALFFFCGCEKESEVQEYREGAKILSVSGMDCSNCEAAVEGAVFKVKGVEWVRAEYEVEEVAFTGECDLVQIKKAIESASHGGASYKVNGVYK